MAGTQEQDQKRDAISGITAELDALRRKATEAEGAAKKDIERRIRDLETKRDSFAREVQGLEASAPEIGGDVRL